MAKVVPIVQLAPHAKRNTLYGRSYGRTSKFFRLDGLLLFRIITGLRFARCELRYNYIRKYQICELNNRTKEARTENFLFTRLVLHPAIEQQK